MEAAPERTTVRGSREEGKRRNRGLSSQNLNRRGRKKSKAWENREWKQKCGKELSTGGTAAGAKPGRMKGNQQKAKYLEPGALYGKPDRAKRGKQGNREGNLSTGGAAVRRAWEEKERKNSKVK